MDLLTPLDLQLTRLRSDFAALKVQMALQKLARAVELAEAKAGFDPNQPRVPAGSSEGGQWTGLDEEFGGDDPRIPSDATPDDEWKPHVQYVQIAPRGGHHYVPRAVYNSRERSLSADARDVFDKSRTGPLYAEPPHGWSRAHEIYNDAVAERLDQFLTENKIQPERTTSDQARNFVNEILRSNDARIRNFNQGIWMREIMYWFRRGPRRLD